MNDYLRMFLCVLETNLIWFCCAIGLMLYTINGLSIGIICLGIAMIMLSVDCGLRQSLGVGLSW